jgi:hypothetical protein
MGRGWAGRLAMMTGAELSAGVRCAKHVGTGSRQQAGMVRCRWEVEMTAICRMKVAGAHIGFGNPCGAVAGRDVDVGTAAARPPCCFCLKMSGSERLS